MYGTNEPPLLSAGVGDLLTHFSHFDAKRLWRG